MGPGFDSRSRCHMWAEFVVGSRPCFESFFAGFSGFPPFTKTDISKFGPESVDEKPVQKATAKFQFIYLLFIDEWKNCDISVRKFCNGRIFSCKVNLLISLHV